MPSIAGALRLNTVYGKWEYFRDELPIDNSSSAVWTNITVAASAQTSVSGKEFVPKQPEAFGYDADGNLTNDGRWSYAWDAENRLIQMAVNTNVGPQYQLNFAYDAKGRRIQKMLAIGGVSTYTNKFLYDGWNLIAILNPQSSILESFTWGSDLSGSIQGAGGVGGLLEASFYGTSTTNCFVGYDRNGNVAALVNATDGTVLANYEYAPFGEVIRGSGSMAKANPFRFSTKYQDDESDLVYYGYRYYKPSTGTWVNRDPINEVGFGALSANSGVHFTVDVETIDEGNNLYVMTRNDAQNAIDLLGNLGFHTKWFGGPYFKDCGAYWWSIGWDLGPQEQTGYIIQQVKIVEGPLTCIGGKPVTGYPVVGTYYEAWDVGKDTLNDVFSGLKFPAAYGFATETGTAAFYWITKLPPSFVLNGPAATFAGHNWAPGMPVSATPPPGWGTTSGSISPSVTRKITAYWDCCCGNNINIGFASPLKVSP